MTHHIPQMVSPDLHIIPASSRSVVCFNPRTLAVCELAQSCANLFMQFLDGRDEQSLRQEHRLDDEQLKSLLAEIRRATEIDVSSEEASSAERTKILTRLIVFTTTQCNLACSYCYVPRSNLSMTIDTARTVIQASIAHFDQIRSVQLFGGEPTLNVPVIRAICEEINAASLYHGKTPPLIGIVTNGTRLTPDILDLIVSHDLRVTVSLDGPAYLNDSARRFADGRETFALVRRNIDVLQKQTRCPLTIQATLTKVHLDAGITMIDLETHLRSLFGCQEVVVGAATTSATPSSSSQCIDRRVREQNNALTALMVQQARAALDSFTTDVPRIGIPFTSRVAAKIITRGATSPLFCEAGFTTLAVWPDGTLYPCHRFGAMSALSMGKITDSNSFTAESFTAALGRLNTLSKHRIIKCHSCWARRLCRTCIAETWTELVADSEPPEHICDTIKAVIEAVLLKLVSISDDADRWQKLVKTLTIPLSKHARSI